MLIHRTEQIANPCGIGHCGMVARFVCFQSAAKIGSRVAFCAAGSYRIAEHLSATLFQTMHGFELACAFYPTEDGLKQDARGNLEIGRAPIHGKSPRLMNSAVRLGVSDWRKFARLFLKPLARDHFKAV